jgi:endonuclease G, mitochondrial
VIEPAAGTLTHDCSTLGGNSGSVVLSLDTGQAVGLHFAGRFLEANFAVPSSVVARRLDDVSSGRARQMEAPKPVAIPTPARPSVTQTFLVPLTVTVQVGEPYQAPAEDHEVIVEAVPGDYVDREGYVDSFLGDALVVPLPVVTDKPDDVLTFEFQGQQQQVLKYRHFSVVMSAGRRMCRFSAVNVDGNQELGHTFSRPSWRSDPRIPAAAQIRDECYGDAPRFSRGHMTRREDPIWGSEADASLGNSDSMHVTNVVPQMQPFNAGVWLELEEYALDHARRDDMKIAVFTGPFLEDDDPTRFGVQVPIEFWKVIAFVHDQTGELCATGYTMSQEDFLSEDEFVFGAHKTAQVSISSIEQRAGLSFGPLAAHDPFVAPEGVAPELTDVSQIQLLPVG